MEFFQKLQRKITWKNLGAGLIYTALLAVAVWVALSVGFSSELGWRIGPRYARSGIPVPNWLVAVFMLVVGAFMLLGAFTSFRSAFIKDEYKKLMEQVGRIGNPDQIGRMLAGATASQQTAGGRLLLCSGLLFYMKGTEATLIRIQEIQDIRPAIQQSGNAKSYYLQVTYAGGQLKIQTKQKKLPVLAQEIQSMMQIGR